jgi:hypothetical protein
MAKKKKRTRKDKIEVSRIRQATGATRKNQDPAVYFFSAALTRADTSVSPDARIFPGESRS